MPYNKDLAAQVRRLLMQHLPDGVAVSEISEKKMFGGLAFMVRGKMCAAISGRDGCEVMLRIGQAAHDEALKHEGVRATVMKGREYRGYVDLDETALPRLGHWIELALKHNRTLPDAAPKARAAKRPLQTKTMKQPTRQR
ncbi:MAG: TfoX/Sxy family protein [Brachymonas sp.]|nr:TfoX/Sxy family protein [Brachymonas sp.]